MPLFFLDIHNGGIMHDDIGSELPDADAARLEAIRALPQIAADEIPKGGDRQHFAVVVKDESGHIIYMATLVFTGLRP